MKVGPAAPEDGDELAGASERQPKRSGVWNKFDDAWLQLASSLLLGLPAPRARASGMVKCITRSGSQPQGEEPDEVTERDQSAAAGDS